MYVANWMNNELALDLEAKWQAARIGNKKRKKRKNTLLVCTKCCFMPSLTLRWDGRLSVFRRVPIHMYLACKITHNGGIMILVELRKCTGSWVCTEDFVSIYYRDGSNGQSNVNHEKTLQIFCQYLARLFLYHVFIVLLCVLYIRSRFDVRRTMLDDRKESFFLHRYYWYLFLLLVFFSLLFYISRQTISTKKDDPLLRH